MVYRALDIYSMQQNTLLPLIVFTTTVPGERYQNRRARSPRREKQYIMEEVFARVGLDSMTSDAPSSGLFEERGSNRGLANQWTCGACLTKIPVKNHFSAWFILTAHGTKGTSMPIFLEQPPPPPSSTHYILILIVY